MNMFLIRLWTSVTITFYIIFLLTVKPSIFFLFLNIILCFLVNVYTYFKSTKKDKIDLKNLIFFLPIFIGLLIVLSPLIKSQTINNSKFLFFPGSGDYYKHSYVITSIKESGLPPKHPYHPFSNLSYYYGYYLIPSVLAIIAPQQQNIILYFYILFTSLTCFIFLANLVKDIYKNLNNKYKYLSLLLLTFGYGLDYIYIYLFGDPTPNNSRHIEFWSFTNNLSFQNPYVNYLWVPQHTMAAILSTLLLFRLLRDKSTDIKKILTDILLLSTIILTSIFVGLSTLYFLLCIFVVESKLRKRILIFLSTATIVILPFYLGLGNRSNIFKIDIFKPKSIFWVLIDYGPILLLSPIFLFLSKIKAKNKLYFVLLIYVPFFLTWFIKTSGVNDFGLRFPLVSSILFALAFPYALSKNTLTSKKLFFPVIIFTITVSFLGFIYEYSNRYKERKVFDPYQSELILKIRNIDSSKKILTIENDDTFYIIPPLAFHSIISNSLYDASVYFSDQKNTAQNASDSFGTNILIPQEGKNISELNKTYLDFLNNGKSVFKSKLADYVLLRKKIFVQEDLSPSYALFIKLGGIPQDINERYSLFEYSQLAQAYLGSISKLELSKPKSVLAVNNKYTLKAGLLYLSVCNISTETKIMKLDFINFYKPLNQKVSANNCLGTMYFNPSSKPINITKDSQQQLYFQDITLGN